MKSRMEQLKDRILQTVTDNMQELISHVASLIPQTELRHLRNR